MSTDHVLASIDAALGDFGLSEDAMRWTPEPPRVICDGGILLWPERYSPLRHGDWHYRITATTATGEPLEGIRGLSVSVMWVDEINWEPIERAGEAIREFGGNLAASLSNISGKFTAPLTDAGVAWSHQIYRDIDPRHRARCGYCNPAGFPDALTGWYNPGPKAARIRRRKR